MKNESTPIPTPFTLSQTLDASRHCTNIDYFNSRAGPRPGATTSPLSNGLEDGYTIRDSIETKVTGGLDNLPNELLAHLFELAYFAGAEPDDHLREVILQLSRRLRAIIINTPSVWSVYRLSPGNVEKSLPMLPTHLERSKGYPLDISLSCFWSQEISRSVLNVLIPHSRRWRHLAITTPNSEIFALLANTPLPTLQRLTLSHFSSKRRLALPHAAFDNSAPQLSSLTLRNVSLERISFPLRYLTKLELRGYGRWPQYPELCDTLSGSESLQELFIHVKPAQILEDVHRNGQPPILLPALRTFTVFTSEWLTRPVADLIRTFSCPRLETLVVREGPGLGPVPEYDIVRYRAAPQPTLSVFCADMELAWQCLSSEHAEKVQVLELRKANWPEYQKLLHMFRSMTVLESLVFHELNPSRAVELLEAACLTHGCLPALALRTLTLDAIHTIWSPQSKDVARFIRVFRLPSVNSLILRNISASEWEHIVSTFDEQPDEYPVLHSLTLADIHDLTVGLGEDMSVGATPVDAFPHLQHLSLLQTHSTPILRHLLNQSQKHPIVWPRLQTIMLSGNTQTSRPLLHKIIENREHLGYPLLKLFLDENFRGNPGSWEWIKERVEIVEI